jgi:hypothetical protein
MALLDDVTKTFTSPTGLALGVGTLILAPVLAPVVASVARPLAKAVLSTGIGLYRQTMEPLSHAVSDLVAEARMEMAGAAAAEPDAGGRATAASRPQRASSSSSRKGGGS